MLFDLHGLEAGPLSSLHITLALIAAGLLLPDLLQRRWTMAISIVAVAVAAGLGRIVMNTTPSVQPLTALVFILGALVGGRRASSCAIAATLISNLELGMGVWSVYQALAWSTVGCVGSMVRPYLMVADRLSLWRTAVFASLLAYPFGWIVSIPALDHGVIKYFGYLWNGLMFDTYHAIGNALFIAVMVPFVNSSLRAHHHAPLVVANDEIATVQ